MSAQSGGTTQRSALMHAGLDFAIRMPNSRIAYQGSWSQRNCIRPARVCCWHLADNSVAPALGRYWSNNGHWPGLARNASVVNDPTATLAVHCGNGRDEIRPGFSEISQLYYSVVLIRLSTFGRVRTVRATQLALIGGSILLLGLTSHSIAQIRVGPGGVEIGPLEDERPREVERPREFDRRPPPRDELRDRMFRLREACEAVSYTHLRAHETRH